jgi:hypothetical protein
VVLALLAELVLAADVELLGVVLYRRERAPVALQGLAGQGLDADAPDARGRADEVLVYKLLVKADGLEDLGPAVGEERRDPHLGDDLEQALADGLYEVLRRFFRADALHEVRVGELLDGLEGEVGCYGGRPVADEQGEVVDLPRLGGLHDERRRRY